MPPTPARALFEVPPDDYVEQRTRLVREARASGDRELARALGALTKPTLATWAVLAAAADGEAVDRLVGLTRALGTAQAAGDRAATSAATRGRRDAIEAFVSAAVTVLARWERSAEARRAEIRTIVDRWSRRADLAEAWRDGTLRDVDLGDGDGEDPFGFGSLGIEVRPSTPTSTAVPSVRRRATGARDEPAVGATADVVPLAGRVRRAARTAEDVRAEREARAARAARVVATREARRDAAAAESRLGALQRRVDAATDALRAAEDALAAAVAERDEVVGRLTAARARLSELGEPGERGET